MATLGNANGQPTSEQIAAMYAGIYPTLTQPGPGASWGDFLGTFGPAYNSNAHPFGGGGQTKAAPAPKNGTGYQSGYQKLDDERLVSPALAFAGEVPGPQINLPRSRPTLPPYVVATYPTTGVTGPIAAKPTSALAFGAPARPAPQVGTASQAIANMFVPSARPAAAPRPVAPQERMAAPINGYQAPTVRELQQRGRDAVSQSGDTSVGNQRDAADARSSGAGGRNRRY